MFDVRKHYDKAVNLAARTGRRVIEASKSPEPIYSFVSPQGIVEYLNSINDDREPFMPARLLSSFQLGSFQGGFRPVGNAIDWFDAKTKFEREGRRAGSYPLERTGIGVGGKREQIGRIDVATTYIHYAGAEERIEEARLQLEKMVKLKFGSFGGTCLEVGPGNVGVKMVGDVENMPEIKWMGGTEIYTGDGQLSPELPTTKELFPREIFLKEEWKTGVRK